MKRNFHLINTFAMVIVLASLYSLQANKLPGIIKANKERENIHSDLIYEKNEHIISSSWTKSVLINSSGSKLYTFNLEEMSIYEFDCSSKIITKKFKFKKTPGTGWDYELNKAVPSFEEKPVEGCFSHSDRILWVSLHNAGGIVAIPMDSSIVLNNDLTGLHKKTIFIFNADTQTTDTISVPFIKTGKTPKVIAVTADNQFLLVSNWHSNTVSVVSINDSIPPFGWKIMDIKTGIFPRGIAVGKSGKSYVANMGSDFISIVNNKSWKVISKLYTGNNPRHIVMGNNRMFVSYNTSSEIACIDNLSNRILFKTSTSANPRTITLSKDQQFLFVACYDGNTIDVFKINKKSFSKIYSLQCKGKPVGIDLLEDSNKLEAWVCTYKGNTLQIFRFKKR